MTKPQLRYALAVIFAANFLSYFDRQIVSALGVELIAHHKLETKDLLNKIAVALSLPCAPDAA